MRISLLLLASLLPVFGQTASHPLDGLSTADYWTVYDALKASGHLTPETMFASVLLHAPAKSAVLAWQPGKPFAHEADVVLYREGKSYTARVDLFAKKVLAFEELKGAQAPFVTSELFGSDYVKKDQRVIDALAKRGITDLRTVDCGAEPVAYRAVPEQATARIGFGTCSQSHGVYQLGSFDRRLDLPRGYGGEEGAGGC